MKILVLGGSGMLGSAIFRTLSVVRDHEVTATVRSVEALRHFDITQVGSLRAGVDVGNVDSLAKVFYEERPELIINCIGLVKQLKASEDPLQAITINALLPHRLSGLCQLAGARLVHISTDCIFSGGKGNYVEDDPSDALDLYGKSKFLGEVRAPHAITLRTSIIGHELTGNHGLIGWFLGQSSVVKGYGRAVFSGLPTVELANVIRDVVIPRADLSGLYHVAASPISKYDLLKIVAKEYGKDIVVERDDVLVINRSLNASRFNLATGYCAPPWVELIRRMKEFR